MLGLIPGSDACTWLSQFSVSVLHWVVGLRYATEEERACVQLMARCCTPATKVRPDLTTAITGFLNW